MKLLRGAAIALAILGVSLCGIGMGGRATKANAQQTVWTSSNISDTESTDAVVNPDCGFYKAIACRLPNSATPSDDFSVAALKEHTATYGVLHFRFGLESFSANAGGTDSLISEATLRCLSAILANLRQAGGTAILRFSYDVNGSLSSSTRSPEPSMALIQQHISQLGEVINENLDVVTAVETGMIGPWGEQHTTTLGQQLASPTSGVAYTLVNAWLRAVDESRTVNVRRPLYYVLWAQRAYPDLGITISNLDTKTEALKALGGDAMRVGVFNDGYLGSSTDLGTFTDRAKEVKFLDFLASHTLYGGEVVTDRSNVIEQVPSTALNDYNTAQYIAEEGYKTHTSYLNIDWNNIVVAAWSQTTMQGLTGNDAIYNGSDGKTFVKNRLGYRLLLQDASSIASCGRGGVTGIRGSIRNVGFGNVVNQTKVTVILREESGANTYSLASDLDLRKAVSGGALSYELYFRLPASIPSGFYNFYLKCAGGAESPDSTAHVIRFANTGNVFEQTTGGNYVGMVYVSDEIESSAQDFVQIDGPDRETPSGGDGDSQTPDGGNTGDGNGAGNTGDGDASGGPSSGTGGGGKSGCSAATDVAALPAAAGAIVLSAAVALCKRRKA